MKQHNIWKFKGARRKMQISRHWRLNPQRYRLQGVRYQNGEVSLQSRPLTANDNQTQVDSDSTEQQSKATIITTA